MKKTVKVITTIDSKVYESQLQTALDNGYQMQSSSAFPIDNYATYVAVLIKEEDENEGVLLPISGGIS